MMENNTKVVTETEEVAGSVNSDTNVNTNAYPERESKDNEISENQSLLHGVQVVTENESENDILDNSFYSELNTSTCSYDSRRSKQRSRRKHPHGLKKIHYPPQYTAIFLDPNNPVANAAHLIRPRPSNGVDMFHQQQQFSTFPVAQRHPTSEQSRTFRQCFSRPSLPFVIGILALGGIACTLGGIVLGSTGLIEHSTQYLSAALLMIGIGVSLLVISGAIWRLSLPDNLDDCSCFHHIESCRNCTSPYCSRYYPSSGVTGGTCHLYPEFQHRPPPPSYLTSLNEYGIGLLFHQDVSVNPPAFPGTTNQQIVRIATPPPLYRSTTSLR
ncbi:hypothetical protein ACFFRR_007898 [Megaselia abdita]